MPHGAQDRTDLDLTDMNPADLALTASAQVLVDEAAYASLVLWGGQVLHGLRFSVIDGRLVLLAPARLAQVVGDDDLACRVLVCGPVGDDRTPVAG
nr:hypothetical protein [Micromonospora sp. DSM 115978]